MEPLNPEPREAQLRKSSKVPRSHAKSIEPRRRSSPLGNHCFLASHKLALGLHQLIASLVARYVLRKEIGCKHQLELVFLMRTIADGELCLANLESDNFAIAGLSNIPDKPPYAATISISSLGLFLHFRHTTLS
jgi:hypothetical protein